MHWKAELAKAEADAWLDLNRGWDKGLPAEPRDTRMIGRSLLPVQPKGTWQGRQPGTCNSSPLPWWRQAKSVAPQWEEVTELHRVLIQDQDHRMARATPATLAQRAAQEANSNQAPPLQVLTGSARRMATPPGAPAGYQTPRDHRDPAGLKWWNLARPQAVNEMAHHGRLRDLTVTFGQRVPSALTLDLMVGSSGKSWHFWDGPIHSVKTDEMVDPQWKSRLASNEMEGWLVLHLTAKEVEALRARAAGEAQPDRCARATLTRAQAKAKDALALY
jgi:hypothetical protein